MFLVGCWNFRFFTITIKRSWVVFLKEEKKKERNVMSGKSYIFLY